MENGTVDAESPAYNAGVNTRPIVKWLLKPTAIITLIAFTMSIICQDYAYASRSMKTSSESSTISKNAVSVSDLQFPSYLCEVEDSWQSTPEQPTIIHIQDAHCNYDAQHRISDIVEYLQTTYGIKQINLEGGTGKYDLSSFTSIKDLDIRRKVADSLVADGELSGTEFYSLMNPGSVDLWGVENTDLYLKNLNAYKSVSYDKEVVGKLIGTLSRMLNKLKGKLFSKDLLTFEAQRKSYDHDDLDLKDYIQFLVKFAQDNKVAVRKYSNLNSLIEVIDAEDDIDFDKANRERDSLIDVLCKDLSKSELEELIVRMVKYKKTMLSVEEFYGYLIHKAHMLSIDIKAFPDLHKYDHYLAIYDKIDEERLFEEIQFLEEDLIVRLATADQKKLFRFSRAMEIIQGMLDLELTKTEYKYYLANREDFDMQNLALFIKGKFYAAGMPLEQDKGIYFLSDFLQKMELFYDYSLKRDEAFLDNIKFDSSTGSKVAVLITGGFHTENLRELMKDKKVSYVSIMPKFHNSPEYVNPYFRLLEERPSDEYGLLLGENPGVSMIAIASAYSSLGEIAREIGAPMCLIAQAIEIARSTGKKGVIFGSELYDLNGDPVEDVYTVDIGDYELVLLRGEPLNKFFEIRGKGLTWNFSKIFNRVENMNITNRLEIANCILSCIPDPETKQERILVKLLERAMDGKIDIGGHPSYLADVEEIKLFITKKGLTENQSYILLLALSGVSNVWTEMQTTTRKRKSLKRDKNKYLRKREVQNTVDVYGAGFSMDKDPSCNMPSFESFAEKNLDELEEALRQKEWFGEGKMIETGLTRDHNTISPAQLVSTLYDNLKNFKEAYQIFNPESYGYKRLYKKRLNKKQILMAKIARKMVKDALYTKMVVTTNVDPMIELALYTYGVKFRTYATDSDFDLYQLGKELTKHFDRDTEKRIRIDNIKVMWGEENRIHYKAGQIVVEVDQEHMDKMKSIDILNFLKDEISFDGIRVFKLNGTIGFHSHKNKSFTRWFIKYVPGMKWLMRSVVNDEDRGIDESLKWEDEGFSKPKERFFDDVLAENFLRLQGYSGRDRKLFPYLQKNASKVKHGLRVNIYDESDMWMKAVLEKSYEGNKNSKKVKFTYGDLYLQLEKTGKLVGAEHELPDFLHGHGKVVKEGFLAMVATVPMGVVVVALFRWFFKDIAIIPMIESMLRYFDVSPSGSKYVIQTLKGVVIPLAGYCGLGFLWFTVVFFWIRIMPDREARRMAKKIKFNDAVWGRILKRVIDSNRPYKLLNTYAELLGYEKRWMDDLEIYELIVGNIDGDQKTGDEGESVVDEGALRVQKYYEDGTKRFYAGVWGRAAKDFEYSLKINPIITSKGKVDVGAGSRNLLYRATQAASFLGYIYESKLGNPGKANEYYNMTNDMLRYIFRNYKTDEIVELIESTRKKYVLIPGSTDPTHKQLALDSLNRLIDIIDAKRKGDGDFKVEIYYNLGVAQYNSGSWVDAIESFKKSVGKNTVIMKDGKIKADIKKGDGDLVYKAYQAANFLGYIYGYEQGQAANSRKYYDIANAALEIVFEEDINKDIFEIVRKWNNQAVQRKNTGDTKGAMQLLIRAAREAHRLGYRNESRRAQKYMGDVYRVRGEWDIAEKHYLSSLRFGLKHAGISEVLFEIDKKTQSFKCSKDPQSLGREIGKALRAGRYKSVIGVAKTIRTIVVFYLEKSNHCMAEQDIVAAKYNLNLAEEYAKVGNAFCDELLVKCAHLSPEYMETIQTKGENLIYFASAYYKKGSLEKTDAAHFKASYEKFEEANRCYVDALGTRFKGMDKNKARSLKNMVNIDCWLARLEWRWHESARGAKEKLDEAKGIAADLYKLTGDSRSLARVYLEYASFYINTKDLVSAKVNSDKCIEILELCENKIVLAKAYIQRGMIEMDSGDMDKAKEYYKKALEAYTVIGMKEEKRRLEETLENFPMEGNKGANKKKPPVITNRNKLRLANTQQALKGVRSDVRNPGKITIILIPRPTAVTLLNSQDKRWAKTRSDIKAEDQRMGNILLRFYDIGKEKEAMDMVASQDLAKNTEAYALMYALDDHYENIKGKVRLTDRFYCVRENVDPKELALTMINTHVIFAEGLLSLARGDYKDDETGEKDLIDKLSGLLYQLTMDKDIVGQFKKEWTDIFSELLLDMEPFAKQMAEYILETEKTGQSL